MLLLKTKTPSSLTGRNVRLSNLLINSCSPILTKLDTHVRSTWQYVQNCGTNFRNFDFEIVAKILNYTPAAELRRPTGLFGYLLV